ncbi:MAG: diguanylate cyclase [Actinomycetota bacterium]|nr:diguanylate cyclase [Actinomycetota bacterium]
MPARLFKAILVVLLAASAVRAFVPFGGHAVDGLFIDWVHDALMVVAAAACLWRAVRVPEARAAWAWAGAALALYAAGEISWGVLYEHQANPPYPSLSDAFWLAFYPAIYVSLVQLIRARARDFQTSLWLDGVIGGLAVAAAGAALVVGPVLHASGGQNAAALITTIAYPLGDLLLLGIAVGVCAVTAWRPGRAWGFIGAALALNAVADVIYTYQSAKGTWVDGSIFDVMYPAAALLLARGAWEPPATRQIRLEGVRLLAVPFGFALLALGLAGAAMFGELNPVAEGLTMATLLAVLARTAMTFRENLLILRRVREDSLTDALTGLANRRRLLEDLAEEVEDATPTEPRALSLFDLDGFKQYNDVFGHPAGDALLARLGQRLADVVDPFGRAYRLGGDEFCVLVRAQRPGVEPLVAAATAALTAEGEGFTVGCSAGTVLLPFEAADASSALQLADQRMYGCKDGRRSSAGRQSRDVLLGVLREREPGLHAHMNTVASLATGVGRRLGMEGEELDELGRAAELHDVGKMAIPDAILEKPGPLDADELEFMRRHTVIGERILAAAPALVPVARLVRASHEHMDGHGYPDGLAGAEIPLGSRIIAVCDAYAAMTEDRPYRRAVPRDQALAELRRCAGGQFDARVVELFVAEVLDPSEPAAAYALSPGAAARSVASKSVPGIGPMQGDVAPESR